MHTSMDLSSYSFSKSRSDQPQLDFKGTSDPRMCGLNVEVEHILFKKRGDVESGSYAYAEFAVV